jgi:hypothetical protein
MATSLPFLLNVKIAFFTDSSKDPNLIFPSHAVYHRKCHDRQEIPRPVRPSPAGAHSGPVFDKLLPLIEDGAALRLNVLYVGGRIERFMGV